MWKCLSKGFRLVVIIGLMWLYVGCQDAVILEDVIQPSAVMLEEADTLKSQAQSTAVLKEDRIVNTTRFIKPIQIGLSDDPLISDYSGGIAPHHDVAYELIDRFYQSLEKEGVDGIIIIGPNHGGTGEKFQVGTYAYDTYSGEVAIDERLPLLLESDIFVEADYEMLSIEHSIGLHMNYIAHYFKGVDVLPIYVKETTGAVDIDEVVGFLTEFCEESRYLVIGSVDFSHYLTLESANKMDQITKEVLESGDFESLFRMNNDYLDSPTSVYMTLTLLQAMGYDKPIITGHDNSANIMKVPNMQETTSYFTIVCE